MISTPTRLLLFDIDGTLIASGGAGESALKRTLSARFGIDDDLVDIEIAGKTDPGIIARILQKHDIPQTPENIATYLDGYIALLAEELPQRAGRVLPGVRELLEALKTRPDLAIALLTGNVTRGAKLKLQHYGLWDYFEFGAFADDHHDRNELGAFAQRRAREKYGQEFLAAQIDVIGDTPHDIACGKVFGARTVAVATGTWSREQLAAHHPDFLFDDLADVRRVIATLGW